MKSILTAALAVTLTLGIAGCTAAEIDTKTSQAQSQANVILTNLSEGAQKLGEKSLEVAGNITESVKDLLADVSSPEGMNEAAFKDAWADMKLKLQEMSDNAVSAETRETINEKIEELDARFKTTLEDINRNQDVQAAKTAMANFWEEVKRQISDLTK